MYKYEIKLQSDEIVSSWSHITLYSCKKYTIDEVSQRLINFASQNWSRYCTFDMYEMLVDEKISIDDYHSAISTDCTVEKLGVDFGDKKYITLNSCLLRRDFCNMHPEFKEKSTLETYFTKKKIVLDL